MDTFSALAEPTRRKIIELLARQGQMAASDIYAEFPFSPPAISQHLKVLRQASLVLVEKQAQRRIYRLNPKALQELEDWAGRLSQLWAGRFDALDEVLETEKMMGMKGESMVEGNKGTAMVDEYIAQFPEDVQEILGKIRAVIKESAPQAEEKISYQMPAFYLNGNLVYFGVHKNHIGFYPTPSGMEAFKEELSGYKGAKGSVQFPLDQPMPYDLIGRIVKHRVAENLKK